MIAAAFDIGASHGDLALWDGARLHLSKHPLAAKTAANSLDALAAGLAEAGHDLSELDELRLCQTWALNAVLTRNAAPVTLVTTRGFGDMLTLARQDRADLYDPMARSDAPVFLVGKVIELDERIGADGTVVTPLDLSPLAAIGSGAVAVCLLNAHRNGVHERVVSEALPDHAVFLSHLVDPAPREYERAVATCLEAWLHDALAPVLAAFEAGLAARGFAGRLLLADSIGMLRDRPMQLDMLAAGPAVAAGAATGFGLDGPVIGADLGSCSLDLSLIRSGRVVSRRGSRPGGVPLRQVVADTVSVALGGESRPVAGGPTVDAALAALGRIEDQPAQETDVSAAARTVAEMARSVRDQIISFAVSRNLDPYVVPLVVMGGLGAVMAADIADALGLRRIHLAPAAAQAGALALLSAPEALSRQQVLDISLTSLRTDPLEEAVVALREDAPPGFTEVWTAEIAPTAQAEPERVILPGAPATQDGLMVAWQTHMLQLSGSRPTQGTLKRLDLVLMRLPAPMPPPRPIDVAPTGWRMFPTVNGGTTLERDE